MKVIGTLVFTFFLSIFPGFLTSERQQKTEDILLPIDLYPSHYLIRVQPFVNGNFSFKGYVEITFTVISSTRQIVLHMYDIITKNETVKVSLKDKNEPIKIVSQNFNVEKQFYVATLGSSLELDEEYVIAMEYEGYLNDQLKGFYRSSYTEENGLTRFMAVTQFAAIDARRAFPCFDEPAYKAEFTIHVIREEAMMSISNMPREASNTVDDQPGWIIDKFETTVPMSTYLVVFIVSDMGVIESKQEGSYDKFRVFARKNALDQAQYSLEIGPQILSYYEQFFEVSFPLPKLDMAAIPDFPFGGMENWGLITYRESTLLHDENQADAFAKRGTSLVVSHELAHQWFGNLVTPKWWTDIWLNEGFASYVEYLGMNAIDPSQKFLDQIVILDLQKVFALDCLETSHPISIPVHHPNEINEIFDVITYQKGASIIRMMSYFLTEDTFRAALRKYLKDLSYKNADQDDLWRYMTEQAHSDGTLPMSVTVKDIMDTWTLQMGFPVLTISQNPNSFTLKQERFLISRNPNSTDNHDYKWWIPLTMTSSSNPDFTRTKPIAWMMPSEAEKALQSVPTEGEWIIFNLKSSGYFRVNYDSENWEALSRQLNQKHNVIDPVNRAQILDDSLDLARSGRLSYDLSLEILSYLRNEEDYVPLAAALKNMVYLKQMFVKSNEFALLKNFFLDLLIPLYQKLGFEETLGAHQLDQLKRIELISWICKLGEKSCVEHSMEYFARWMDSNANASIIPPNLKNTVFCTAIAEGGDEEWEYAWQSLQEAKLSSDILLENLACSKNQQTLRRFLEDAIDPHGIIRKQDVKLIVSAVARNPHGKDVAWLFLRERWNNIAAYFGSSLFTLSAIVESVTKYLNTQEELVQLQSFHEAYRGKFLSAARAIEQAEETVRININWMSNYHTTIAEWLREHKSNRPAIQSKVPPLPKILNTGDRKSFSKVYYLLMLPCIYL